MCRYLSTVAPKTPKPAKTNLTLPMDLATGLDELLAWAKHQKYVGRSDVRNDLIRYLLARGVEQLRAEMAADQKLKKRR